MRVYEEYDRRRDNGKVGNVDTASGVTATKNTWDEGKLTSGLDPSRWGNRVWAP